MQDSKSTEDTGKKPVVLILLGAFWPGSDSAGPNQSVRGFCAALGDAFDFKIVARDRPFGGSTALAPQGEWIDRGFAHLRYCPTAMIGGAIGLGEILRETKYDLLMSNGFFDREFTLPALFMRRAGKIPRKPMIVSTRGEFAGGALGLKSLRKRAMLTFAKSAGLHRDVWLHATGPAEAADVARGYDYSQGVLVAPNVRVLGPLPQQPVEHAGGRPLRLAFAGRISRVKNLHYAIDSLKHVKAPVSFDIYGPMQDKDYWAECQKLIAELPAQIRVKLKGEIANEKIVTTLANYDLFFLPTMGENFGHAIVDALEAGVPVVISDQTPFRELEQGQAGFDLPLYEPLRFAEAIDRYASMDSEMKATWRQSARALAERTIDDSDAVAKNKEMLNMTISSANAKGAT